MKSNTSLTVPFATHICSSLLGLLLLSVCSIVFSCQKATILDEGKDDSGASVSGNGASSDVRILTRTADGSELDYPLHVFAFGTDGKLVASQKLLSSNDRLQLSLPQKKEAHVVVISADESVYDIPDRPTMTSVITMKAPDGAGVSDGTTISYSGNQGYGKSPLRMGVADIVPSTEKATVTISLSYQVSMLQVTLTGLPASVTSPTFSASMTPTGIAFDGTYSGGQTTRVPLVYDTACGAHVISGIYVFPVANNVTFTISYNGRNGEEFASVRYLAPLVPGTPYTLNGTYADGAIKVSGAVTPATWNAPVNIDFCFSPDEVTTVTPENSHNGNDPVEETPDIPSVQAPRPLSLYQGHIVVAVMDANGNPIEFNESGPVTTLQEVDLLLLSLVDQADHTAAQNMTYPTTALDIASTYSEFELQSGWRVPTAEEAVLLRNVYLDYTDEIDNLIASAQADPIVLTDEKGNNLRYLCDEARKTFSFKAGSSYNSIRDAGGTVKNYRLRMVTTVRVTTE